MDTLTHAYPSSLLAVIQNTLRELTWSQCKSVVARFCEYQCWKKMVRSLRLCVHAAILQAIPQSNFPTPYDSYVRIDHICITTRMPYIASCRRTMISAQSISTKVDLATILSVVWRLRLLQGSSDKPEQLSAQFSRPDLLGTYCYMIVLAVEFIWITR